MTAPRLLPDILGSPLLKEITSVSRHRRPPLLRLRPSLLLLHAIVVAAGPALILG